MNLLRMEGPARIEAGGSRRAGSGDPAGSLWQTVLARDGRFDGRFVFAVRSTGIYCRPSCPARRPSRERVTFYRDAGDAERAGFRACLRCRPADPATPGPRLEAVRRACRILDDPGDTSLSLAALGERVGMKPGRLRRAFRGLLGITPRQYAAARRLRDFKARARQGESVTAAMYDAGYASSSRLYERARARLGMTPGAYRRGGRGARIRYTLAACPLGRLLVGATESGVCAVSLGDSDARLESALAAEYPAAEIRRDDRRLGRWVDAILGHLEGRGQDLDLPLDVRATAFQWQVWRALQRIPYGMTRTYAEVARAVGRPGAARAVARACATNPVALLVPCHRVVRAGGDPGGYRWGARLKQALLAREATGPAARGAAQAGSRGAQSPRRNSWSSASRASASASPISRRRER